MTVILIILLIICAPFIGAALYGVYLIVTGKDKDPEIQAKLEDYKKRKAEKKAKKKEMKHIIHKEFAKNRVMVEESDDETEYRNTDPQIVYVEKPAPVRIRRRLNLLDRFK